MKRIIATALLGLSLVSCAPQIAQFEKIVSVATSTVTNPISSTDIYRVKNVYAATLQLAVDYRKVCWSGTYAELMADPVIGPVCKSRREVVRRIQSAKAIASIAVRKADAFVKNNPTINASVVINEAWSAVTAFQAVVPSVK